MDYIIKKTTLFTSLIIGVNIICCNSITIKKNEEIVVKTITTYPKTQSKIDYDEEKRTTTLYNNNGNIIKETIVDKRLVPAAIHAAGAVFPIKDSIITYNTYNKRGDLFQSSYERYDLFHKSDPIGHIKTSKYVYDANSGNVLHKVNYFSKNKTFNGSYLFDNINTSYYDSIHTSYSYDPKACITTKIKPYLWGKIQYLSHNVSVYNSKNRTHTFLNVENDTLLMSKHKITLTDSSIIFSEHKIPGISYSNDNQYEVIKVFKKNKLKELYNKQDSTDIYIFDYDATGVITEISRKNTYYGFASKTKILIENPKVLTPKLITIINENFITKGINHFAEYNFPEL